MPNPKSLPLIPKTSWVATGSLSTSSFSRIAAGILFSSIAPSIIAQVQSNNSSAETAREEPVLMSEFQVQSTENQGYTTRRAASAFKTDASLLTIPQPDLVVTRDMITDTGYNQSSDVLAMVGVANYFRGESYAVRGARLGGDLIDEMPNISAYMDNEFIDSYEIIRGPAAVYYPTTSLGGIVLKTTKKPLAHWQNIAAFAIDQWGHYRASIDSTGPIGKIGDGVFGYRLVMSDQDGKTYYDNERETNKTIHPSLQWTDRNNRFLIATDSQWRIGVPMGEGVLKPDGSVLTYGNRRSEYNQPAGGTLEYRWMAVRVEFDHKIGTNWEMKLFIMGDENHWWGVYLNPVSVNFVTDTSSYNIGNGFVFFKAWDTVTDFTGKYNVLGMETRSTFGYTLEKENLLTYARLNTPYNGQQTTWNNIPFTRPNMNFIIMPNYWQLPPNLAAFEGASFKNYFAAYYQQDLYIIPDRLSAVACGGWDYIESDGGSGYQALSVPFTATDTILSTDVYRIGFVFQIVKNRVALYGLNATTAASNGTNLGTNGLPLPPQRGRGMETGIKTDLFNGAITSTAAVYDIELTNVPVFAGVVNGVNTNSIEGKTIQKGWDADVTYHGANFELIATYYFGSVETQQGLPGALTYRGMWTLFGRYIFPETSALRGLLFGGGASEINGRLVGTSGMTFTPQQQSQLIAGNLIMAKDGVLANGFATYRLSRHWMVTATVDNILNSNFAQGAQAGLEIDVSPPITFGIKVTYQY